MSNLVKRMDLRRAKAALPWIPRAILPHAERRAGAPARPTPFARAARFALLALVLGAVLLWSTSAEAQTARILVSNVSQSGDDSASLSGNDHAQLFHTGANTGANTGGWTLTSLIVVSEDTQGDDFDVEICEADGTSDNFPTTTCTELTRPDDFTAGNLKFTHRGIRLNANANYVAVFKQDGSENVTLDSTTAAGEDSTGLTGWSIKNKFDWKGSGAWQHKGGSNEAIQITVNGYETPPNQDATGQPIIFPSAEGAGILLAHTYGIDDPNGSTFVDINDNEGVGFGFFDFSYQWIRVDGVAETNIGVDSPRDQPVDADIGKLIKVQVSFKDAHNYSETVTSLPFGPLAEPAGPSQPPSTLVGNTGQSHSATAMITQQYAMGFRLGNHGQGYEISSVSIELAAVPTDLTVSLWIGVPPGNIWKGAAAYKLFDFTNPPSFQVGLNKFTAPAGAFAYHNVEHFIVLSGFGGSLSIKETTSDAEDAGGETGAILFNDATVRALSLTGRWSTSDTSRGSVLRLAVEGSQRASGILASNYAQTDGKQEIVSVGDEGGMPITLGAADRYLIRGFSWLADATSSSSGGIHNPFDLRSGWTTNNMGAITNAGAKWFSLIPTRYEAGINVWTAPQGATVAGGGSYLVYEHYQTRPPGIVLSRFHGTLSDDDDPPTAPGVTLSDAIGDLSGRPLMAFLGEPLHAMVQNLGQADNSFHAVGGFIPVLSQGVTTGPTPGGYRLQGIGVNIEGSDTVGGVAQVPDDAASVSVAVYSADADGKPAAKLFDLLSPTEYAPGHSFFEAPAGTTLAASTSYVVVWSNLGGTLHRLQQTSSDSEDSGALTAFSIANVFYRGTDIDSLTVDSGGNSLEIAVYGGRPASRVLVSNVGQGSDESAETNGDGYAQLFHTAAMNDYTLTSVIVVSEDTAGDDFDVEVCEADTTANEFPTSTCTTLTRPASFTAGSLEFTHAGLALSASSNYVVVITQDGSESVTLDSTTATGEDSTGLTGWSIKDYFYWNDGTWQNEDGENEALQITVNGYERATAPTVTGVAITSLSVDATNGIGLLIEATVTFSAAVDITGSPQLELDFAGTAKAAACTAATNTTTMVCNYRVAVGDVAAGGVAIAANKLTLNGGTIYATGSTTNSAVLTHSAVAIDANHKVDGIRPTLVTTGSDAPTTSTDGTQVILTFSENLASVDRTKITIGIGGGNVAQTSAARVVGTEVELDLSTIIDATVMLTVALGGVAVLDGASNGNLALAATTVINAVVSTTAPTVTGVEISPPSFHNIWPIGDEVVATVTFSAAVDITGAPQLELDFDGTPKAANCTADTNTTTMECYYVVATGDSAAGGIAIAANKLTLNGGTIYATGSTTIAANRDHSAVAANANHKVDSSRPTLVTTGANAPTTTTDGTQVILTFSEDISFVDRAKITIMSGTNTLSTSAARVGLIATKVELDLSTVVDATVMLTVALAESAVRDAADNANLAVAATTVINAVGTTAPSNLTATLENGDVRLNWDAPGVDTASVTGYAIFRANPQLTPPAPLAIYDSNTGNAETTFLDTGPVAGTRNTYRVAAWRGSVGSANSNSAFVDVPPPAVLSVALTSNPGSDNTYAIGDTVEATVTFSVAVDISGAPRLELNFDGTAKMAACATATTTTTMVCSYEVAAGDSAPNGVAIAANKLTGGTIRVTGSTTAAIRNHSAVAANANHKVDGILPRLVTTGSEAPRTSTDGTQVILTFSEAISSFDVDSTTIAVGGATIYQQGATVSLSGRTVTLTLVSPTYTIVSGQTVTVALSVGAVRDAAGNGNLAVAATPVTNVVGVSNLDPSFPSTEDGRRSVPEGPQEGQNVGGPCRLTTRRATAC